MTTKLPPASESRPADLAHEAVDLVRRWLDESRAKLAAAETPKRGGLRSLFGTPEPRETAELLADLLREEGGLEFAVGFVDGVARPQDVMVAGYNLQRIAPSVPHFLPWVMRAAMRVGGVLGPVLPWIVVPLARRVLRRMVGHLVVDAGEAKLGDSLARLREMQGPRARFNLNLLGEAVLGEREAARRLEGTRRLLERDDVDYVSIKVSSIASQVTMWGFDEAVHEVVERLTPLYEYAAESCRAGRAKFINLDMEEYHDLDLTLAVFRGILDKPQLQDFTGGIVLQAYLPDALDALQGLTEWATARRAGGGAPIKVRIVKGANLPMEQVDAAIHGWPQAPYREKRLTDANYLRVLDWALTSDHTHAVRLGIAGHNLFDIAWAWLLARRRGVDDRVEFEMLLGLATAQADAVVGTVGPVLLYTPVVHPEEFDVAISYLIRRLEENASDENFMSVAFDIENDPALFEREKNRFLASLAVLDEEDSPRGLAPLPNRTQDRSREWEDTPAEALFKPPAPPEPEADAGLTDIVLGLSRGSGASEGSDADAAGPGAAGADAAASRLPNPLEPFRNAPDTDPSLPANRRWAKAILAASVDSRIGEQTLEAAAVDTEALLDHIIETARRRGIQWGTRSGYDRATLIDRAGLALAANRDRLIEVMASETGKTVDQADPEVSEAVDFAHYYAARARELDTVQGARFEPAALTVVTPPWNFPVSIPAGSVLGPLAAGSAVILKPAPQARRCAAVVAEALWEAGVPRDLLILVDPQDEAGGEGTIGSKLITDPRVDRVVLTGAFDTAKLFRSMRPDLQLQAETSGKNAIIVTPSADYDLAVADIVHSAFGHAGQKCSAASLLILVGSTARSPRFLNQLVDATASLHVGYPSDRTAKVGPLIEPASGKLLHALTTLGTDEEWLVEPKKLDATGRLWSPGIRTGVTPGSYFHLTEFFGPVLGIMRARTLEEAIAFQNAVDYGLTSGLHSLDHDEIALWLDTVQAGNLYVNRGITGAIVQRQPFGGWKRSSVGTGFKAGGPNYLIGLGSWRPQQGPPSASLHLRGLDERVQKLIESGQSSMEYEEFDLVRRSALSDAIAYANEFGVARDAAGVGVERNLLRYRPVPVSVRLAAGGRMPRLLRVLAAATLARSRFDVSAAEELPRPVRHVLASAGVLLRVESDADWLARMVGGHGIMPEEAGTGGVAAIHERVGAPVDAHAAAEPPAPPAPSAQSAPPPPPAPPASAATARRAGFDELIGGDGADEAGADEVGADGAGMHGAGVHGAGSHGAGAPRASADAVDATGSAADADRGATTAPGTDGSTTGPDTEQLLLGDTGAPATGRVRLVDASPELIRTVRMRLGGNLDLSVFDGEVTPAGRIELLPFLREQAVSITAHRFGTPSRLTDDII